MNGVKRGFTLIEILTVLVVLSILILVVALSYVTNASRDAKASEVAQNFRNIKVAVENYWNTERPTNVQSVNFNKLVPDYLSKRPADFLLDGPNPISGQPNVYEVMIIYSGNDVDIERVRKQGLSEVSGNTGNMLLVFNLQKWW